MRAALALCALLCGCTLDPLFFSSRRQEGPYDLSGRAVPADRFDPDGAFVESADGTRIHLMYVAASGANAERARTAVLYCHGNGGNIGTHWARVEHLHGLGYQVLVLDYRGFGRSAGRPAEQGLYEDAEAAWRHLLARPEVDPRRVVLYGHSLGAAVCTDLAARRPGEAAALVLEAPFRSIAALVEDGSLGALPREFVATLRFANDEKIANIGAPLLIMHGLADDYLMPRYGQELYDLALPPRELWLVPEAGHGDIPGEEGGERRAAYLTRLSAFIDAAVPQ